MYGRKVKLRFLFVVIIFITLILTVFLVLKSLEQNVVYFQSPSEIKSSVELNKSKIRIGGMVKKNSISINVKEISFIITDFKNNINSVGISAGASTPDWIISSVIEKVKELTGTKEKEIIHESRVRF